MHTIQGLSTELRNDVGEKKFTVHEVSYSEKSDMPRSEMRVSAIVIIIKLTIKIINIPPPTAVWSAKWLGYCTFG